jgi:hypothetical protein
MKMKVYLAGPMRGYPNFNFPMFEAVTDYLRRIEKFEVFSPAEKDLERHDAKIFQREDGNQEKLEAETDFSLRDALGSDLAWICKEADGIVMLPGWEKSLGATAERATALALDLKVFYWNENGGLGVHE